MTTFVISATVGSALCLQTYLLYTHQGEVLVSLHLVLHDAQDFEKLESLLELGLLALIVIVPGVSLQVFEVSAELAHEDFPEVLCRSLLLLDDDILF